MTAPTGTAASSLVDRSETSEGHEILQAKKNERILVALAIVLLWVLQSSADVVARGIATSKPDPPGLVPLPGGLTVTRTAGRDEPGWTAVAVRFAADGDPTEASWLLVNGDETEWVDGADITFA